MTRVLTGVKRSLAFIEEDTPLYLAILGILLDRLVTVLYWSHESNPIVSAMGMWSWLGITVALIAGLCYVWFGLDVRDMTAGKALAYVIVVFHVLAAISNVYVVTVS